MAKLRGTIKHSDLEGGHIQLSADDGIDYELEGTDPLLRRAGLRVEIDGTVDGGTLSFTMTGPRLKVKSVKALG
jgi:hypothetical protein